MPRTITLPANTYRQFDADPRREVPAEGLGGWQRSEIEISLEHTAIVSMHAWRSGPYEDFPGWYRCAEFLFRANPILSEVYPPLFAAVRRSPMRLFHVSGCGNYHEKYPGYAFTASLAPYTPMEKVESDPVLEKLREFKWQEGSLGRHNVADVKRGFGQIDFPPEARPLDSEPVAATGEQLFALCRHFGINHLIYIGFAINWCLLMSRGGMVDMNRRGVMCSTIRQAVTAVENKETARGELCKEIALWRVAHGFGFVFDLDDFVAALHPVLE